MSQYDDRRASAKKIRDAIASGSIETTDRSTLTKYSAWLCTPLARGEMAVGDEHEQVSELVRLHMLRTMMDAFEERSKIMQRWVVLIAALAVIATMMPYVIAPTPIFGAPPSPRELASKTGQDSELIRQPTTSAPYQTQRPSNNQAAKQGTDTNFGVSTPRSAM